MKIKKTKKQAESIYDRHIEHRQRGGSRKDIL